MQKSNLNIYRIQSKNLGLIGDRNRSLSHSSENHTDYLFFQSRGEEYLGYLWCNFNIDIKFHRIFNHGKMSSFKWDEIDNVSLNIPDEYIQVTKQG
uniref:TLDc domain-containing protein n=1 Tax=Strongyloides venezuelensis TaxID=75913 RepID=A0A0K0G5W7_STRVS